MGLSPKQIRVAQLLSQGHSQEQAGKAVGASRRTVSRWLQQEDFRNLSYGLVGRAAPQPPQQAPQRSQEKRRQSNSLTPQDLVGDALAAVKDILVDPDSRSCDRIKAASLIGQWAGLGQPAKMVEMQALQVLVEANWVSSEVLEALINGGAEFEAKMKNALANGHQNGHENGHKKAPLQLPEEGTFDDVDDDDFEYE